MNRTLLIRLGLLLLALTLARLAWSQVKEDVGMMLVYFVALGAVTGFLVVKFIIPWIGDAVGTMMFSSVETIRPDEGMRAAAKLAQGDYEGAIAEHEKNLEANPEQTHPAVEIARICTSKLQDPHRALSVLLQHLASREWPEDDAAFLRFRIADVHLEPLHDFDGARRQLEQVIADFPNTRHSANAQHRLHEIEQEEYKFIMEQRRKSAGQQAS